MYEAFIKEATELEATVEAMAGMKKGDEIIDLDAKTNEWSARYKQLEMRAVEAFKDLEDLLKNKEKKGGMEMQGEREDQTLLDAIKDHPFRQQLCSEIMATKQQLIELSRSKKLDQEEQFRALKIETIK